MEDRLELPIAEEPSLGAQHRWNGSKTATLTAQLPRISLHKSDALLTRIAASAPDLAFNAAYLVTWIAPRTFGERAVAYLMLVMLLECIIVHASGFIAGVALNNPLSERTKVTLLPGLTAFFAIFAAALSLGFGAWWPVWTLCLLLCNRLLATLTDEIPKGGERASVGRGWAVAAVLYLVSAAGAAVLPFPALGITDQVARAQVPGGLWLDEPHRIIAFGFLYFLLTGLSELLGHTWLHETSRSST